MKLNKPGRQHKERQNSRQRAQHAKLHILNWSTLHRKNQSYLWQLSVLILSPPPPPPQPQPPTAGGKHIFHKKIAHRREIIQFLDFHVLSTAKDHLKTNHVSKFF